MKNLATYISLLFMAIFVVIASFAPVMAFAEETPKNEEISADIIANEEILGEEDNIANTDDNDAKKEDNDNVLPATKSTTWFEEKIEPLLWRAGADVVALGAICAIVLKRSKKAADSVNAVAGLLVQSNDNNKESAKVLKTIRKENEEWKKEMEEQMAQRFDEMRKDLVDTGKDTNEVVHKLLCVEEIAYEENPSFVSNGTAKKIAEVIRYGENKT